MGAHHHPLLHSGSSLSMAFLGFGRIIMLCASASAHRHATEQHHSTFEPFMFTGVCLSHKDNLKTRGIPSYLRSRAAAAPRFCLCCSLRSKIHILFLRAYA